MDGKAKNKILKILKNRSYGLTIREVANILKIHRVTASKYLAVLEAERKIQVREVGKAKLHYPNGKGKINFGRKSLAKVAGALLIILISFFVILMISRVIFASPDTWSSKLLGTIDDDTNDDAYFEILNEGDGRPSYSGTTTKYAVKLVVTLVSKLDGDEYAYCDHSEDGSSVWGPIGNVLITAQQTEWINNSIDSGLLAQIDHDGVDQEWIHCNITNINPADEVTYDVYVYFEYTPTPTDNPPTYAYNDTNVTSGSIIANGTVIKIYANWTDDNGLNYTWYESNETSSWVNSTEQVLTDWSNFTIDTLGSNFDKGETFGARIFANDTAGNENYTIPTWYWTIDADPVIQGDAMINNTTAVVASETVVRWNVTVTDDVGVNITFFENDTTNITATEGSSNEWYVERTCSISGIENWVATYANDSLDQWSSNTSVGIAWECDANAPTVTNTGVNDTKVNASNVICVNHTASDSEGNLDQTWVQITFPNSTVINITTSNTIGVCNAGGDVYAVEVNVGGTAGNLTINTSFANDTAGQVGYQSPFPNLTVNVSTPPNTPPTIAGNAFINNTSAVVGQGIPVKWNVTITDSETEPSVVFFQNDTTNITASNTSSEYWIVKTCSASEYTENWTAIYANDTADQWASNTSVNLAWSCDVLAPRVENQSATGTIEIYNNITYRFNVSDKNLDKVWVNLTTPSTPETNYTATQDGGTGWYLEINATELGNYYFEGFANDTLGQENQTDTIITVTSQDTTKPKWSNNVTSPTSPVMYVPGQNYQFNITWTDNLQVNETILEFDGVNYTYSLGELSKSNSEYYKNFTDLSADNYNYKWYANDTSSNWNYTDQLLYQINKAPTDINLTLNGTDTNKAYELGEIANLTAVLNVSDKTVYIDANYTGIPQQIASDTDSSVTNLTDTGNLNLVIYNITGYFSGDQNYSSNFETHYMTVKDTEKPQYSNLKNTSAVYNQDFQANATWTENYQLDKVLFESNYTSTLQNYTVTSSGSEYYFTILAGNHTAGNFVVWKWYANDTSNNMNHTSQFNYTVTKAPTEIKLWLNGTRGNRGYINNTYTNFTVQLNASGKTIYLTSNMTGFGTISNSNSLINNVTHLKETGTFNMTAYWNGDENYTADSETWYATVSTQNMQTKFTMVPTSINQEKNSTVSANCTCVGGTCTNSFIEIQADESPIPNVGGSNLQVNGSSAYDLGTINDGETTNASWNITGHNAGTYVIRIKCNSTETGDSFSTTQDLQVNDTTKPTWSVNKTSPTSPVNYSSGASYQFNVTWSDNVDISKVFIEHNFTEIFDNYTMSNDSSEYYYDYSDLPADIYAWKSYTNDTKNNWNSTDQWIFRVEKATPSTNLEVNETTVEKGDAVNITSYASDALLATMQYANYTGILENITGLVTGINTNITDTSNLVLGGYQISANTTGNANYTDNSSLQTIYMTVEDTKTPKYSNLQESADPIVYGDTLQINSTWTDNDAISLVWFRSNYTGTWQNYSVSQDGSAYYYDFSTQQAPAGNLFYNFWANDTSNNWNITMSNQTLTINQANISVDLYLNGNKNQNLTITHPTQSNATGAATAGTANLYRNGTSVLNSEITTLGNGIHSYKVNATGNQNYTDNSTGLTYYLFVNKGTSDVRLFLNGTEGNKPYTYENYANITATLNISGKTFYLEANFTGTTQTINQDVSPLTNVTNDFGAGVLNITTYWSGDQNYTGDIQTYYMTVSKKSTTTYLWLNGTRGNRGYINESYSNLTVELVGYPGRPVELWANYSNGVWKKWDDGNSPLQNITQLNTIGTFNFTGNYSGNANYTDSSESWVVTVSVLTLETKLESLSPTSINQEGTSTAIGNCSLTGGTANNIYMEIQADGSVIPNVSGSNLEVNGSNAYYIGSLTNDWRTVSWDITGHNAGNYVIRIKCNSTETGDSFSTTQNLQVNDTTKPTWSNNQTDIVTTYSSTLSYFNITWTDNVEVDKAFIEGNWSGSPQNYTMLNYSNVYSYNDTLPVGNFYWKSYANDTSNNWNVSDSWYFTITKAPTSTRLFLNGTENDRNYNKSDIANLTATVNISGKNVQIWTDFMGTMQNLSNSPGSTPLTNITDTNNLNLSIYNITAYFAGDQNYTESSVSYQMEVYKRVEFNGTLKDASGNPVNATIKIFKPDTNEQVGNFSTNTTGHYNKTFNSTGFHDVLIEVFNDSIKLLRANLSDNALDTLALDSIPIENITISDTRVVHKGLAARINLTYQNVTVCFNYTLASIQYENTIKIFKCQEWNFTYRSCNNTWSKLVGIINTTSDTICVNQTNFSAYAAAEAVECGNGECESDYGESCSSCPADCGSCPTVTPSGEEGPSRGAGEGIAPTEVTVVPDIEIIVDEHIQIIQGEEKLVNVIVKNTGNATLNNVSLQIKGVKEYWREILDQNLIINVNESVTIRVMFKIPSNALVKNYSIEFIVSSNEITESKILILEIKPKSLLMRKFDELSSIIKNKIDRFVNLIKIMKDKGIPTGLSEGILLKARDVFRSATKLKEFGNYTGAVALLQEADVFLNSTSSSLEEVITTEFGRLVLMVKLTLSFTLIIIGILIYDKRKKIFRGFNTLFNLTSNLCKRALKPLRKKPTIPKVEIPEEVPKVKKEVPEVKPPKFKMPRIRLPKITVKMPKVKVPKVRMPRMKIRKVEVAVKAETKKIPKMRMPRIRVRVPKIKIPKIEIKVPAIKKLKLKTQKVMMEIGEAAKKEVEIPKIKLPKLKIPRVKMKFPEIKPAKIKEVKEVPKVPQVKKKVSEIKPPKFKMPRIRLPKITVKMPKVKVPKVRMPRMKIPKVRFPKIKMKVPKIKIEKKVSIPTIKIPKIKIKKLKIPRIRLKKPKTRVQLLKEKKEEIPELKIPPMKIPKLPTVKIPEELKKQRIELPKIKIPTTKVKIPKELFPITVEKIKEDVKEGVNTISDYIFRKRKRKRTKSKKEIKRK